MLNYTGCPAKLFSQNPTGMPARKVYFFSLSILERDTSFLAPCFHSQFGSAWCVSLLRPGGVSPAVREGGERGLLAVSAYGGMGVAQCT